MQTKSSQTYILSFCKHFLFSGLLLFLSYLYFGIYYEEYQGFWNALFSGALSPGTAFDNFYFLGYIGISYVYNFIQTIFPNVQWFSVFHFLQLNIAFALFFSMLSHFFQKLELKIYWHYLIFTLVFTGLFLDNIILFVYARASYVLCAAVYLALILFFKEIANIKKHPIIYISLVLLFLWGDLTRVESAMATVLLLFCFAVVWHQNLKFAIISSIPVLIIVGISLIGIFVDINTSDQFHKQVEPDIETQFTVRFNIVPVSSMECFEDSVKYEAAVRMFWADPEIITIPYLRSLLKEPKSIFFDKVQWQRVQWDLTTAWNNFKFHFIFAFLLTAFGFVLLAKKKERGRSALLLLYFLGLLFLLVQNSYLAKMRDRTISPFILIYLFSLLLLVFRYLYDNKNAFYALVVMLCSLAFINVGISKNKAEILSETREANAKMFNLVKEYCKGATLLVNPSAMGNVTLAFTPLEMFDFESFDHLYFYEASIQSLIPPYSQFLTRECNCDIRNFSNFYRYVLDPAYPSKTYVLSNEDRMEVAMVYLKTFHSLNINYLKVEAVDLNENLAMDYYSKRKLYLYQISLKQ